MTALLPWLLPATALLGLPAAAALMTPRGEPGDAAAAEDALERRTGQREEDADAS